MLYSRISTLIIILCTGFALWIPMDVFAVTESQVVLDCGEKPVSISKYEQISYYALIAGFVLIFISTLVKKPGPRLWAGASCLVPFTAWGYIHFMVDFEQIRQKVFNYNLQAESALNNVAEAQDRYKSEQQVYIEDLDKLHSHVAGANGLDRCINILELKIYYDYWTAVAQHVSSPEKVHWDSRTGSSLKKG